MYIIPPWRYCGSSWSSDSTGLNSSIFEKKNNACNCNIIDVYFNAYWLFEAFDLVLLRQSECGHVYRDMALYLRNMI